jgi:hypothetical protein
MNLVRFGRASSKAGHVEGHLRARSNHLQGNNCCKQAISPPITQKQNCWRECDFSSTKIALEEIDSQGNSVNEIPGFPFLKKVPSAGLKRTQLTCQHCNAEAAMEDCIWENEYTTERWLWCSACSGFIGMIGVRPPKNRLPIPDAT